MPFLDFDRVNTLLAAQITRDAAALVAMLEVQTTELKEIRDILQAGGGGGGTNLQPVVDELAGIKNRLNQIKNKIDENGQTLDTKQTNINDTLEDIEQVLKDFPGPPSP